MNSGCGCSRIRLIARLGTSRSWPTSRPGHRWSSWLCYPINQLITHYEQWGEAMIIDCHAHLVAPDALYAHRSVLLAGAGHVMPKLAISDGALAESAAGNVAVMDGVGTDVQMLSPRPFQQMHSARPTKMVHRW